MIRFAFKSAAEAAKRESGLAKVFSEGIAGVTGGKFSHVEIWYDGPQNQAKCFAAREPDGTGFATLDLSDTALWEIIEIEYPIGASLGNAAMSVDSADYGWFQGRTGRRYNFAGIAGIGLLTKLSLLEVKQPLTDPHGDFCSQCAFEFLQDRRGLWLGFTRTELIAPSGFGKGDGRYGLYELLTGAQTIPTAGAANA